MNLNTSSISDKRQQASFLRQISRNRETVPERFNTSGICGIMQDNARRRREVMKLDIRQKIDALLDKITSQQKLKRIYNFAKYVYIYTK